MMTVLPHPPLLLGEGPRWDLEHRRLLLVDILRGLVFDGPAGG
jgi:sugar lactone lactonase YvrE